jgi:hypothetical protein
MNGSERTPHLAGEGIEPEDRLRNIGVDDRFDGADVAGAILRDARTAWPAPSMSMADALPSARARARRAR